MAVTGDISRIAKDGAATNFCDQLYRSTRTTRKEYARKQVAEFRILG